MMSHPDHSCSIRAAQLCGTGARRFRGHPRWTAERSALYSLSPALARKESGDRKACCFGTENDRCRAAVRESSRLGSLTPSPIRRRAQYGTSFRKKPRHPTDPSNSTQQRAVPQIPRCCADFEWKNKKPEPPPGQALTNRFVRFILRPLFQVRQKHPGRATRHARKPSFDAKRCLPWRQRS